VVQRILLVDDEPFSLAVLAKLLKLDGFEVTPCHDPSEALTILAHEHFDAVISDLEMPAVNGLQVLKAARDALPDAVLILVTAAPRAGQLLSPRVTLVCKPIEYEELLCLLVPPG